MGMAGEVEDMDDAIPLGFSFEFFADRNQLGERRRAAVLSLDGAFASARFPRSHPNPQCHSGWRMELRLRVLSFALPSFTSLRDALEESFYGRLVYEPTPAAANAFANALGAKLRTSPSITVACHRAEDAILIADPGNKLACNTDK